MRKIFLFMHVSLDGYFEGPNHDITWAYQDPDIFTAKGGDEVDTMLFGHRTYEGMKSFWPTPQAAETQPNLAKFMNEKLKIVASHKPFEPGWNNVRVISQDVPGAVRKLKEQSGKTIAMFGSNNLVVSLMEEGLIDEFQIMVNPVVLGEGTSLFKGLSRHVQLDLRETQKLKSGRIFNKYVPIK